VKAGSQTPAVVLPDNLAQERASGRIALFSLGTLLIVMLVVALVVARTDGGETKAATPGTSTSTTSRTATAESPATTASKTTAATQASKTTTGASNSTTTTAAGASRTTTKSTPSEAVLLALLGTGAVLILAGALYARLSVIKLPGGAEIQLSPEERERVIEQVAANAGAASPPDVAHAMAAALQLAHTTKTVSGGVLDADGIRQAAAAVTPAPPE
jgi:hypothetical protein